MAKTKQIFSTSTQQVMATIGVSVGTAASILAFLLAPDHYMVILWVLFAVVLAILIGVVLHGRPRRPGPMQQKFLGDYGYAKKK